MEAASTSPSSLLTRDGAVPVTASARVLARSPAEAIDGVARCLCCHRFPLVGESVCHRSGRRRSGWVCDRCETAGRGDRVGAADGSARVRSLGGALNVRRAG